ncbi:MAG: nicotinate-nucleotide adenylyltransferase [Anaerolineales bacterium]|jgi:nicotinate-nucleotide adenylyltransferase
MRIGIFGGTFDPPHLGHLILGDEACDQLELDQILWVLTPFPPHKQDFQITPVEERLELLQSAVRDEPAFEISRVEIEREGPHYAVDTINLLRNIYPKVELIYLMGGDSLDDLPNWHQPVAFVATCNELGVMKRPGSEPDLRLLEEQIPGVSEKVRLIKAPVIDISSSDIRRRVATGRPFRHFLPVGVYRIILERSLYLDRS